LHLEKLADVYVRVEMQPVGHQVAAVGALAGEGVQPYADGGAAEVGQYGRGTGVELIIDRRVDPQPAQPNHYRQGLANHVQEALGGDRQDVFRRNHIQGVEDESVFLEDQEVHVFPADALDGLLDGWPGQHGGALLGGFDEENAAYGRRRPGPEQQRDKPPPSGHGSAGWHAHPPVHLPHRRDFHRLPDLLAPYRCGV
jgi:hypothetical protein